MGPPRKRERVPRRPDRGPRSEAISRKTSYACRWVGQFRIRYHPAARCQERTVAAGPSEPATRDIQAVGVSPIGEIRSGLCTAGADADPCRRDHRGRRHGRHDAAPGPAHPAGGAQCANSLRGERTHPGDKSGSNWSHAINTPRGECAAAVCSIDTTLPRMGFGEQRRLDIDRCDVHSCSRDVSRRSSSSRRACSTTGGAGEISRIRRMRGPAIE